MSEQTYGPQVQSFRAFWRALQSWVKKLIFWVGVFTGLLAWFAVFSAMFPLVALIFLGIGTPALVLKVFVIVAIIISFVIAVVLAIWLLRLVVYCICWIIFASDGNVSMGELIFKKKDEV